MSKSAASRMASESLKRRRRKPPPPTAPPPATPRTFADEIRERLARMDADDIEFFDAMRRSHEAKK